MTENTEKKETSKTVAKSAPVKKESAPKKKTFTQTEGVKCASIISGPLYLDGAKSLAPYVFADYGDVVEVEYRDLVALVRERSSYLTTPLFIVQDENFIAEYPFLAEIYAKQYTNNELSQILNLPVTQMIEEINLLPENAKSTLKDIATKWVANGRLDSVKKIKALDEIFEMNLSLAADVLSGR